MEQDSTRTFIHLSRAWYGPGSLRLDTRYVDEVTLGKGINVRWYVLNDNCPPEPRLEAFDDEWAALSRLTDVIAWMGTKDNQGIPPLDFCEGLRQLGLEDVTPVDEERRADLVRKIQALLEEAAQ